MKRATRPTLLVGAWLLLAAGACNNSNVTPMFPDASVGDGDVTGDGPSAIDATSPPDLFGADFTFSTAAHPTQPQIPSGNMMTLSPLTVVTITAMGDPLKNDVEMFADQLITSAWWQKVGVDAYQLPNPTQSLHFVGPAITANMNDNAIQAYILAVIQANANIAFNDKTVYLLYLPDKIAVLEGNTPNTDCYMYEGYHWQFNMGAQLDNYAVIQRCYGNGKDGLDDITNTASHEIIESATDPDGAGWTLDVPPNPPQSGDVWLAYSDSYGTENADLCGGTAYYEGGYQYQRVWDNAAAAAGGDPCAPALTEPYFNTSPTDGWYPIAAGATLDIPIVGWSTAPTGDWYLETDIVSSSRNGFMPAISANRTVMVGMTTFPAINNGETGKLSVTAPPSALKGAWAVFVVYSTLVATGTDYYHSWPVGVYVP